ncbi:MAG: cytochrome P450 [Actinomycetota bacterium]
METTGVKTNGHRSPERFPIGSRITLAELSDQPYRALASLRAAEPVSWVPAIGAWLITRRDLAIEAMRDAERFTVDDPRFSTAAVLGPSMLSVDGPEHDRHRGPFAPSFRPGIVRERFGQFLDEEAARLVGRFVDNGRAELRTGLAGPLAVNTITRFLGLRDVTTDDVLGWYGGIAAAITKISTGGELDDGDRAITVQIHERVEATLADAAGDSLISRVAAEGVLQPDELGGAAAVLMFGAIETAEGMTANALWHLLTNPSALAAVADDRSLVAQAIEESLRLEPAAAVIDRYTTDNVDIGGVIIPKGDLVTISLLGANRDPDVFDQPDRFDLARPNKGQHVTFVHGPHGCLGLHLTRMETAAAINAILDGGPKLRFDAAASDAPAGLIFRKPNAVVARWD